MSNLSCLVVCEGSSDFAFIEGIINKTAHERNVNISVKLIKPELDATSGKDVYEKFGYKGVENWCRKQAIMLRTRGRNEINTLAAFHNADLILIHLDADIADKIVLESHRFNGGMNERREWCARGIDLWLGTAKTAINFQYVIPTLQIETWLLATYDPDTFTGLFPEGISDYESITNVESLLLSMGYEEDKEKPGRLYKQKTLFENNVIYVPRLLRYIDKSTARCKELFNFKQLIENYC